MNAVAERLRKQISAEGPIGVDTFMAEANAHYYATRDPIGAAGDFVTAPEISQMFGEIIGAALVDVWVRAGSPARIAYVEWGPGRGTLATDALRVMAKAGLRPEIHFVETSPVLREIQSRSHDDAQFHTSLLTIPPDVPLLIIANELFDALPIRQWIGADERRVTLKDKEFAFTRDGEIREDSPERESVAAEIAAHLHMRGGVAVIIDYGHARSGLGDTLQAVSNHRFANVLANPGEQDLTAHVDFAALARAATAAGATASRAASQGSWLETLGIGARAVALAAKNPSETNAIAAARRRLCDDDQMGRLFKVMAIRSPDWPDVAGLAS